MATFGTFWIICKIAFALIFWGFILYNLPRIIAGILAIPLAIIAAPFILSFLGIRYLYQDRLLKRIRENESQTESASHFKEEIKPSSSNLKELCSLLGVSYNASKEEIRFAFRNKMMMNHPDKLAALDPELQRIATERTIAIKNAYERLTSSVY